MKLSNNHWDNTEDDDTFEDDDFDKPSISFKALAWGAGLTVAVVLLGLKVWSLFQR